jgi:hypothetical protein
MRETSGDTARWENKAAVDPSVLAHSRHTISTFSKHQVRWRVKAGKLHLGAIRQGTTAQSLPLIMPLLN